MRNRWIVAAILVFITAFVVFLFYQQNRTALLTEVTFGRFQFVLIRAWLTSLLLVSVMVSMIMGLGLWRQKRTQKGLVKDAQSQKNRAQALKRAEHLLAHENYREALSELEKVGRDSAKIDEMRYAALVGIGDATRCHDFLREAFARHKTPAFAYPWIESLAQKGKVDEALDALEEQLKQEPAAIKGRLLKLELLERKRRWSECLESLAYLQTQRPDLVDERRPGYLYEHLKQRVDRDGVGKTLLADVQDASKQYPDFVPIYILWASSLLAKNEAKKAFDIYERAYRQTGNGIFLALIEAYYIEHDRPEDAIQIYRQLMVKERGHDVAFQLGKLYQNLEMMDDAFKIFNPLKKVGVDSASLNLRLADVLARLDREGEAFQLIREFVSTQSPLDRDFYCTNCTARHDDWSARCHDCHSWNTIELEISSLNREPLGSAPIYY